MKKQNFINLLLQRINKKIKPKKKNPPRWLFPINQEKNYDKVLYSLVFDLKNLIKQIIIPEIPSMIEEVKQKTPQDRNDNYQDRLNGLIIYIKNIISNKVKITIIESINIAKDISDFNKIQAEKLNHSIFGIDIFTNEPWLQDQLSLFANQNAQLITSIPDQELDRVSGTIERGLQQGTRFTEIAKELQKSFGITKRRATLIARDQTAKLNSSLTRLRQEEVGVEEYIWQTSGDERVRPTHRQNDGKKFKWAFPPKETGHPGHDINCRCIARPVLDKF